MRNFRRLSWILLLVSALSVWAMSALAQQDDWGTEKPAGNGSEAKPPCEGPGEPTDQSCTGCCSGGCTPVTVMSGRDFWRCM
ncbi:MAG: hypothetical protein AB1646_21715 [Thermodesulfobacteriota bacterium]